MAGTFDLLRANDLIFSYVVSGWLIGQDPPAFDLLAWNADSTGMPAAMHSFYLRCLYMRNELAAGRDGARRPAAVAVARSRTTPTSSVPSTTTSCPGGPPTRPPRCSAATSGTCCPAAATSPASSTRPARRPGTRRRTATRPTRTPGGLAPPGTAARGGRTGPGGRAAGAAARSQPPPMGSERYPPGAAAPGELRPGLSRRTSGRLQDTASLDKPSAMLTIV